MCGVRDGLGRSSSAISSTVTKGPDKQRIIPPTEWLAEVMFQPEVAETRRFHRVAMGREALIPNMVVITDGAQMQGALYATERQGD